MLISQWQMVIVPYVLVNVYQVGYDPELQVRAKVSTNLW